MQRGETKRKIFHPLIHSSSDHNGQCCDNPKPGATSFFQVSHMGAGSQGFGPSLTAFLATSRELDGKWDRWD